MFRTIARAKDYLARLWPRAVEMNEDFQRALSAVEASLSHVYITGRAGTGKSTLLKILRKKIKRRCAVLAPTGLAALNVEGQTIHSFFGLPPRVVDKRSMQRHSRPEVLRALDLLIIDEASMVRADLMDCVDYSLRFHRGRDVPFGGVQIVMLGDLCQLPPVVSEQALKKELDRLHGSPYFFHAHAWRKARTCSIELRKIYRQKGDLQFQQLLDQVRIGAPSAEMLELLNARVVPLDRLPRAERYIVLTATNRAADDINSERLRALSGRPVTFRARIAGSFDEAALPAPDELTLKAGAKVVFTKNDSKGRWVNGSSGIVVRFTQEGPKVRLANGAVHLVTASTWENVEYRTDGIEGGIHQEVIGSLCQLPLKLGWAMTIHKSQGQTFDRVCVDLGAGAFAHGQVYVALSRCRSLSGITLARPLVTSDLIVDRRVHEYLHIFPPHPPRSTPSNMY